MQDIGTFSLDPFRNDTLYLFLTDGEFEFHASEEHPMDEIIEQTASLVSKIFAAFPRLDEEKRSQLRREGVWLAKEDSYPASLDYPSESQCKKFETDLKQKIIDTLSKKGGLINSIKLGTDYSPEFPLSQLCNEAFPGHHYIGFLFPRKCSLYLNLYPKKAKLELSIDLQKAKSNPLWSLIQG